jgi:hypothetical protein
MQSMLKEPPPIVGITPPSTRLVAEVDVKRLPSASVTVNPLKDMDIEDRFPVPKEVNSSQFFYQYETNA